VERYGAESREEEEGKCVFARSAERIRAAHVAGSDRAARLEQAEAPVWRQQRA
jgi:hypothetical protein